MPRYSKKGSFILGILGCIGLGVIGSSCEKKECIPAGTCEGPGVCEGQVTIVFKAGVTRAQIDEINAEIGATIGTAPTVSNTYRIVLPPCWDYLDAHSFYSKKCEVQAVLMAINYGPA